MAYWKISGDPRSVGCTSALVGDLVEDRETSTTYIRIGAGNLDFTPATSAFTSPTSPTGTVTTVEEADGSPSYTSSITTLRFDQADGFVLTNPVAGVVRVDLTAIPEANVANLTTDLAGKAATSHTHAESDVTGLVTDLAGKAATSHSHATSDITNLADTNTRVAVAKNSAATTGTRRQINLIEGTNVTMTVADDNANERVNVTVNASVAGVAATQDIDWYRQIGTSPLTRYYIASQSNALALTTLALAANAMWAIPFVVTRGGTLDSLNINPTVGGTSVRLGIYSATSATNLYPSALLVDGGTVSVSGTGIQTAAISQVLAANTLYWFVCNVSAAVTVRALAAGGYSAIMGSDGSTVHGAALFSTVAFGSLAGTFAAGATVIGPNSNSGIIPALYYHYSA